MAEAALSGTYAVAVDAAGHIAVVVGIDNAPSPLWADMLLALDSTSAGMTMLKVTSPETSAYAVPTQVEIYVREPDHIPGALDWLRDAIEMVNTDFERHERHLAATYQAALDASSRWFGTSTTPTPPTNGHIGHPGLN